LNKKYYVLIGLSMLMGCLIFFSWLRTQEGYQDDKGRYGLRYSQQDSLWKKIDQNVFLSLNGTMRDNPAMQWVWGVTNHRSFDLVAAMWMVLIFLMYYIRNPRNENRVSLIQFGLYITVALLVVSSMSELTIHFHRMSPGATEKMMKRAVLLTDLKDRITWPVKIGSNNSFPGDHAAVLLFIGSFIIWRLKSWYGWAAGFGMFFFALPRLAGGGHWFSDIFVGSLFFYLILFPLFISPPVYNRGLALFRKPAQWIYKLLKHLEPAGTEV